jgi:hypothetical protein
MNIHSPFITVVKALSKFAYKIINSRGIVKETQVESFRNDITRIQVLAMMETYYHGTLREIPAPRIGQFPPQFVLLGNAKLIQAHISKIINYKGLVPEELFHTNISQCMKYVENIEDALIRIAKGGLYTQQRLLKCGICGGTRNPPRTFGHTYSTGLSGWPCLEFAYESTVDANSTKFLHQSHRQSVMGLIYYI